MKKKIVISFWMHIVYNSMFVLNIVLLFLTIFMFSRYQLLKYEYLSTAKHTGVLFAIDCKNEETTRSFFKKQIDYYSNLSWSYCLATDVSVHHDYAQICLAAFEKKIKQLKKEGCGSEGKNPMYVQPQRNGGEAVNKATDEITRHN